MKISADSRFAIGDTVYMINRAVSHIYSAVVLSIRVNLYQDFTAINYTVKDMILIDGTAKNEFTGMYKIKNLREDQLYLTIAEANKYKDKLNNK